jgi:hypothetical protein
MPVGEIAWKRLRVLAHQTVLESAKLDFPEVRTGTRFLAQWLDESGHKVGQVILMVYPQHILKGLKPLADEQPVGLFDPLNQLKPLLKTGGVDFEDLEGNQWGRI